MTKLTNKVALSIAVNCVKFAQESYDVKSGDKVTTFGADEVIQKLSAMIEKLDTKTANTVKKPTAQQIANEGFKTEILNALSDGSYKTATEIQIHLSNTCGESITNQRVSALLHQLKEAKAIDKVTSKGKSMFFAI